MMMKDRITKLNAIGMGSSKFVTRDEWAKDKTGSYFIHVKTMKDLPKRYNHYRVVMFSVKKNVRRRKM